MFYMTEMCFKTKIKYRYMSWFFLQKYVQNIDLVPQRICTRFLARQHQVPRKVPGTNFTKMINYLTLPSSEIMTNWLSPTPPSSLFNFIYLTFLHCVFSNVSSNCWYGGMKTHTGCICLAFLRCVFSNASSNCLAERMHRTQSQVM